MSGSEAETKSGQRNEPEHACLEIEAVGLASPAGAPEKGNLRRCSSMECEGAVAGGGARYADGETW